MINYLKIKRGFTLIEMLVVVSLIGVLTTLVAANLNSARERARDTQRKSDLRNLETSLRLFYQDYQKFPDASSGVIVGCGTGGGSACPSSDGSWTADSNVYMSKFPGDPLPDQTYKYSVGSDNETYTLDACLENKSDEKGQVCNSQNNCDPSWCTSAWMYRVLQ